MKLSKSIFVTAILLFIAFRASARQIDSLRHDSIRLKELSSTTYLLNAVSVIGQRYKVNTFDRPEAVTTLNSDRIKSLSAMSMPDQASNLPGVFMQKTNHGGGSPFMRGLTGYQVLIMVDGIRFNNSTFRSGPNQYLNTLDHFNVRRLEAIRGSGSVQYGSDAIGGVLMVMTKKPEFSDKGFKASGSIYGKEMSSDMEYAGRAEIGLAGESLALSAGLSYSEFGDIKAGGQEGILSPTGYDQMASDIKLRIRLNRRHEVTFAYQYLRQEDVPLYHKIISGDFQLYTFDPQERELAYLRLSSDYSNKIFSEVKYTFSYQNSREVRKKTKPDTQYTFDEDKVNTLGGSIELISNINRKWRVSSGMEYYADAVSSYTFVRDSGQTSGTIGRGLYPDDSKACHAAVYSLHNFDLNRWNISAGVRYNSFRLSIPDGAGNKIKIEPDAFVGNIGVIYKLNPHNNIVFSANSAFRAPNINDVSSFGEADHRFEIPNYDLKPEYSYTLELGWKTRYDRFSAALYGYSNFMTDLMTNTETTYNGDSTVNDKQVYHRVNSKKALILGSEAELEYAFSKDLVLYGNLIYTYGQDQSKEEPMRRIPPFNGRAGIRFNPCERINTRAEWLFAAKQTRLSGGDEDDDRIPVGGTPGWDVLNIYAGYSLDFLDLNVGLQNIFDKKYKTHGSGVYGPGKSVWVSLRLHF